MEKTYRLDYNSNDETNEFLRCLWSRLRNNFGKIAWDLSPIKNSKKTEIIIDHIDLGNVSFFSEPTQVSITYSKKGCLKTITFSNSNLIDEIKFISLLSKSIDEAKNYNKYQNIKKFATSLDESIEFIKIDYKNFSIDGNKLIFKISGYDDIDAKTIASSKIRFIKSILSFDTLKFINSKDSGITKTRNENFREIRIINQENNEILSEYNTADQFKYFKISPEICAYIDKFLSKPISYNNHLTSFEKSILFFAEGLFFEELYSTSFKLDFNCMEYAITSYMSSLELITINDVISQKCNHCNQETFSISKRIIELTKKANVNNDYLKKTISNFYNKRSKFVHTGQLTSSYNYIGNSIPLLSVDSENGIIDQLDYSSFDLKYIVKDLILYQIKENKDFT